uniref:VHS domain-containing protein n=1 Tax=Paramoeba aestuarina TaxID=180227 RepID=A0A7S4JL65_9EUKA|eukprot:CAMPEP_0201509336 /NCGR_PEP_ID=MMETSP0161_2-20130828/2425_1 /ASSEMBLY_ACC=CAM_ASM_000251 /TAXON_ID=180227 /ORGANISM="Neoparamoeba aestuarina, Strain SoJaBio B1-5/56/2" /LENGTH=433 /DNA_ID=CAMNT_0047904259 /DNA_START=27 /DNA_END=1328 /DNA_ORIENTATION=+
MSFDIASYTLQELVERATSEMLLSPDWEKNFLIVEEIHSQPSSAKNILEYIKQRLSHEEEDVVFLSLSLLETLMQNNHEVIPILNTDAYQTVLYNLGVSDKTPFKSRNKVLDLIRMWSEGLMHYPLKPQNNFSKTFLYLKGKGVKFPPVGPNTAKFTPPASPASHNPPPQSALPPRMIGPVQSAPPAPSAPRESKEIEKIIEVGTHVDLLMDIFAGCDPKVERVDQNDIVKEILPTLDQFATKNRQWAESGNIPENLFGPVLELNDRLVLMRECYDELCKGNRHPALEKIQIRHSQEQQQIQPPPRSFTAFDLIDQTPPSSSVLAPAPPSPIRSPSPPPNQPPNFLGQNPPFASQPPNQPPIFFGNPLDSNPLAPSLAPNPLTPSPAPNPLTANNPLTPHPLLPTLTPTPPTPAQQEEDDIMAQFGELANRHG